MKGIYFIAAITWGFLLSACSLNNIKATSIVDRECYKGMEKAIMNISGNHAIDCGFFTIDSDQAAKDQVKTCLSNVINSDASFRVGHKSHGDDSEFCDIAVRDKDGHLWSIVYDFDVYGGGSNKKHPKTWVTACGAISLNPGTIGPDSFFDLAQCDSN